MIKKKSKSKGKAVVKKKPKSVPKVKAEKKATPSKKGKSKPKLKKAASKANSKIVNTEKPKSAPKPEPKAIKRPKRRDLSKVSPKTKLLIATHNNNKRTEIRTLLKDYKAVVVMNLDDLPIPPPMIIEDGRTFRQNAVKKAVTISRFYDGLVLADDSGLEVSALHGKPGVRSARFARKNATDKENNKKLLNLLSKIPEKNRSARFVCHLALAHEGRLLDSFEGVVKGKILFSPRGSNGFGYDPVFVPDNYSKTFAEMTASSKNRISHRSLALKQMKMSIGKYL